MRTMDGLSTGIPGDSAYSGVRNPGEPCESMMLTYSSLTDRPPNNPVSASHRQEMPLAQGGRDHLIAAHSQLAR